METRLQYLKKDANISTVELAENTGIDRSVLCLLENGRRSLKQNHINDLCFFYSVSTDFLLNKSDDGIIVFDTDMQSIKLSLKDYESIKPNVEIKIKKSDLGTYISREIINDSIYSKKIFYKAYLELGKQMTEEQLEKAVRFIKDYIIK